MNKFFMSSDGNSFNEVFYSVYRGRLILFVLCTIGFNSFAKDNSIRSFDLELLTEIANICRSVINSKANLSEALKAKGLESARPNDMDHLAEILAYSRRLERAINSTYVPRDHEFQADKIRAFINIENILKISSLDILIHEKIERLLVTTSEKLDRHCGFIYIGDISDLATALGYRDDNASLLMTGLTFSDALSIQRNWIPKNDNSNLGVLITTGMTALANSNEFGGEGFFIKWIVKP